MNRYIIMGSIPSLYYQAKTGTLRAGDTVRYKNNIARSFIVDEVVQLQHDAGYRIRLVGGMGFDVSKNIQDQFEKYVVTGGKKKRKSRRNKKTKRGKSQRRR
jgi:hypothetical protein